MEDINVLRENMKNQLEVIKGKLLDNSVDKQKALEIMQELSELTLLITSFEFTQRIVEDPSFLKEIKDNINNDRPSQ